MSQDYWEPYAFKPGDRVRVHISAECRADHPPANGRTGTMTELNWDPEVWGPQSYTTDDELRAEAGEGEDPEEVLRSIRAYDGHNYCVTYDEPIWDPDKNHIIKHDLLAGSELELLRT